MLSIRTTAPRLLLLMAGIAFSGAVTAQAPICSTDSDSDGDGWGWENNKSCRVVSSTSSNECIDTDGDGYGWDGTKTCTVNTTSGSTSACIDSDGDGYGWDGTKTCTVNTTGGSGVCLDPDGDGYGWDGIKTCTVNTNVGSAGTCLDPDGDGYGWDGIKTCTVAVTPAGTGNSTNDCYDPDGDGYGWDGTQSCVVTVYIPPTDTTGVTDVILMMGQSNALGEDTTVNLSEDDVDSRVVVWTQFDGWQIGNLCTQKWQKAWFPWRGGICSNHPAFQIAKHIVELDPSRRVAVIPTGAAGKPIRWWDANGIEDFKVANIVQTALASLGRSKVDLIAWSQGEADHGNDNVWELKLQDLILRLRKRPWFDANDGQFIAQETKWSSINTKVRELSNDGDPLTDWVPAADLPTKDGVHWSGAALRIIGERFADKYVN